MTRPAASHVFTFKMGDALPASERFSSWVSVVALIHNDAVLDSLMIAEHQEHPAKMAYFTRIAAGHVYEAAKFAARTSGWSEVQALIAQLDAEQRANWATTVGLWDRSSPLRPAIDTARHHVFHYPDLDREGGEEMKAALQRLSGAEGSIEGGDALASQRCLFADELALNMILHSQAGEAAGRHEPFIEGLRTQMSALLGWTQAALGARFAGRGTIVPADSEA